MDFPDFVSMFPELDPVPSDLSQTLLPPEEYDLSYLSQQRRLPDEDGLPRGTYLQNGPDEGGLSQAIDQQQFREQAGLPRANSQQQVPEQAVLLHADYQQILEQAGLPRTNYPQQVLEQLDLLRPKYQQGPPEKNRLPRPKKPQRAQLQQPPPPQEPRPTPKRKSAASASRPSKKAKIPPLPATVEVRGYEITIPNTKTCWRVSVVFGCGHPVLEVSEVRYPGCDKPLVVEINRHMRACTEKCKTEELEHVEVGLCPQCWERKHEQEEGQLTGRNADFGVMTNNGGVL